MNVVPLVMIVDDDSDARESLAEVLGLSGYGCVTAEHGRAALDQLRREGATRPSVIILDVRMPVMDGWAFRVEQLRDRELASIPVIFLTADLGAEARVAASGGFAFVAKPYELGDLLQAVRRAC